MSSKQRLIFGSVLLSACASVAFGFFILDLNAAIWVVKNAGYWLIGATFSLFLWHLFRLLKETGRITSWSNFWKLSRRESIVIALVSICFLTMSENGFNIVMDQPVLAATAFQMHQEKKTNIPTFGYEMGGAFHLSENNKIDKRPLFFPFLVSLLHDFTGYRPLQGVWLNALLTPVFVGLLFTAGRAFGGTSGGMLAMALFLTLPLLSRNACGGGFELLNLIMILVVFRVACGYLQAPTPLRLNLLVLSGLLLAQTRYESSLYVLSIGLVVLAAGWRMKRVELSWITVLAPLLMLCVPLQNKIIRAKPAFWELREGDELAFSLDYIGSNLGSAANFFFGLTEGELLPISVLLSVLFCLALLASLFKIKELACWLKSPGGLAAASVSFVLLINGLLLMAFHYGQMDNFAVTRLILPVSLFQVLYSVRIYTFFRWNRSVTWSVFMALAIYWFGVTRPLAARVDNQFQGYDGIIEVKWLREKVSSHRHESPLFLTQSNLIPLIERVPAIQFTSAFKRKSVLELYLRLGVFGEIFLMYKAEKDPDDPAGRIVDEGLNQHFEYELLDEYPLSTGHLQFSRLTRVKLDEGEAIDVDFITPEFLAENPRRRWEIMKELLLR